MHSLSVCVVASLGKQTKTTKPTLRATALGIPLSLDRTWSALDCSAFTKFRFHKRLLANQNGRANAFGHQLQNVTAAGMKLCKTGR